MSQAMDDLRLASFNAMENVMDKATEIHNNASPIIQNISNIFSAAVGLVATGAMAYGIYQVPGMSEMLQSSVWYAPATVIAVPSAITGLFTFAGSNVAASKVIEYFTPKAPTP